MELGDVEVAVVFGRVALSCKKCSEEIQQYEPGQSVDLDVVVGDVEAIEHDCEDTDA